jgi:hypothetical protein
MNKTQKKKKSTPVYSKQDFNSNDGMLTSIWGPGMWHYLHTMSFNYPVHPTQAEKEHYRDFILSLQNVLPCGKCRKNLQANFKKLPLEKKHMANRETFSRYIYRLHELINTMLGKKSGLSYRVVRERYEHFRARCSTPDKKSARKTQKRVHFAGETPLVPAENGCTESLYGEKAKCVLKIVPQAFKCDSIEIDSKCIKKRLHAESSSDI